MESVFFTIEDSGPDVPTVIEPESATVSTIVVEEAGEGTADEAAETAEAATEETLEATVEAGVLALAKDEATSSTVVACLLGEPRKYLEVTIGPLWQMLM